MGPEQLFEEFVREYRREGGADPRGYLSRLGGAERAELQVLIEAFLERAGRRPWDPEAFSGSLAERALARAGAEAGASAEEPAGWPVLLPALRTQARLKRRTVVERLARALGLPEKEQRVAAYYHQMEQGQLRPSGVSATVLEALAAIIGSSAEGLRRSGEAGQRVAEAGGEVFARVGAPEGGSAPEGAGAVKAAAADAAEPADELDLLFLAGDADVR